MNRKTIIFVLLALVLLTGFIESRVIKVPSKNTKKNDNNPKTNIKTNDLNKNQWPELKGTQASYAQSIILKSNPNLNVVIVPQGSMVTMDYRTDRVRLFVDKKNKIVSTPVRG